MLTDTALLKTNTASCGQSRFREFRVAHACFSNFRGKLGLQSLNLPGQVPNTEEAACVDRAALIHVISTHVRQARCREIDSRAGHHPMLDSNVFEMMILNLGCGFNFDHSPALVFA